MKPLPRVPHNAVMLGIDPGASSGWAVLYMGHLLVFGRVRDGLTDSYKERDAVVRSALDVASGASETAGHEVPVVVAIEKFGAGGGRFGFFGARTVAGIERRVGSWIDCVVRAGIPRTRIVRVLPQTWRYSVLGKGSGPHEEMAALTLTYVQRRFDRGDAPTEDECAAIGIGCWMLRAPEVEKVLPKRRARR